MFPHLPPIILASSSPRRSDLLRGAGLKFSVITRDTEEIHDESMEPQILVRTNAEAKARVVSEEFPENIVIGADTLVALDDKVLGKPVDLEEARDMLRMLSGKTHTVWTGVQINGGGSNSGFACATQVTFRDLDEALIEAYISLVDVLDKAGSYAYQEHGEMIIADTKGDTDNVIGLPTHDVLERLAFLDKLAAGRTGM